MSALRDVNARLKGLGREERLIRVRGGYMALTGGESARMRESGLYGWGRDATGDQLWAEVKDRFLGIGVDVYKYVDQKGE